MERKRASEEHSPTGEYIGRDKSGHGKKARERGTHFLESASGGTIEDKEGKRERARGTHVLESGLGGTSENSEERERARCTHSLESASGGTSENTERKRTSEREAHTS